MQKIDNVCYEDTWLDDIMHVLSCSGLENDLLPASGIEMHLLWDQEYLHCHPMGSAVLFVQSKYIICWIFSSKLYIKYHQRVGALIHA